jgi:hypothetical protein
MRSILVALALLVGVSVGQAQQTGKNLSADGQLPDRLVKVI